MKKIILNEAAYNDILNMYKSKMLNEAAAPENVVKKALPKFKSETTDSDDVIKATIDSFYNFRDGIKENNKRDIFQWNYKDLKSFVQTKKDTQLVNKVYSFFKKINPDKLPFSAILRYAIKYCDIYNKLPEDLQKYDNKTLQGLISIINKNYNSIVSKIINDKFKDVENEGTIVEYTNSFLRYVNQFENNRPLITNMTFSDLEHLVDAERAKETATGDLVTIDEVPIMYDENGLIIYRLDNKVQAINMCVKYGTSWCIGWPNQNNRYYNYRIKEERTIYVAIDESNTVTKDNTALCILVNPDGGISCADRTNAGQFSGHQNLYWNVISSKNPKLSTLKNIFVSLPLRLNEEAIMDKFGNIKKINGNLRDTFNSDEEIELWLDLATPELTWQQFNSLNETLQKKYISLVQELPDEIVKNATPKIQQFIIDRKIERILGAGSLKELSMTDIEILNLPQNEKIKRQKKEDFTVGFMTSSDFLIFDINNEKTNDTFKYGILYGFDEVFNSIPNVIQNLKISNKSNKKININIPESINKLTKIFVLSLNNVIENIPNNISIPYLKLLDLSDNPELEDIPSELIKTCVSVKLTNCKRLLNSNEFKTKMTELGFVQDGESFRRKR